MTEKIFIAGGEDFSVKGYSKLQKKFGISEAHAKYLNRAYGSRANHVAKLMKENPKPLAKGHQYTEGEVVYVIRNESARSTVDILGRRLRLSFLDHAATLAAIPRVSALLGQELNWNDAQMQADAADATKYFA